MEKNKSITTKKLILSILLICSSAMAILSLLFPVVKLSYMGKVYLSKSGFSLMTFSTIRINQFHFEINSTYSVIGGIYAIAVLLLGGVSLYFSICYTIKPKKQKFYFKYSVIFSIVAVSVYALGGIILSTLKSASNVKASINIVTLSYIPILIVIIFLFAYIICQSLIPEQKKDVSDLRLKLFREKEDDAIVRIKSLYELVDTDMLTKKEYINIKKKILAENNTNLDK